MRNRKENHVIYFKQFYILAQKLKKTLRKLTKKAYFGPIWPLYAKQMANMFIFDNIYFLQ